MYFSSKTQRISCHCHFSQVLVYTKSFNEGKKLHTDECYVCIISFIRSVLALTRALALGYDFEALALALGPWPWP